MLQSMRRIVRDGAVSQNNPSLICCALSPFGPRRRAASHDCGLGPPQTIRGIEPFAGSHMTPRNSLEGRTSPLVAIDDGDITHDPSQFSATPQDKLVEDSVGLCARSWSVNPSFDVDVANALAWHTVTGRHSRSLVGVCGADSKFPLRHCGGTSPQTVLLCAVAACSTRSRSGTHCVMLAQRRSVDEVHGALSYDRIPGLGHAAH
jgi:hypothetical protein